MGGEIHPESADKRSRVVTPDMQAKREQLKFEEDKHKHEATKAKDELSLQSGKNRLQSQYWTTWGLFGVMVVWLAAVWLLVAASGAQCRFGLKLSDGVLIALLTTSTVKVLGLFAVVAHHLFPKKGTSSGSTRPTRA